MWLCFLFRLYLNIFYILKGIKNLNSRFYFCDSYIIKEINNAVTMYKI
jgi:hypothetical protein